jgi:hypothetical protein
MARCAPCSVPIRRSRLCTSADTVPFPELIAIAAHARLDEHHARLLTAVTLTGAYIENTSRDVDPYANWQASTRRWPSRARPRD